MAVRTRELRTTTKPPPGKSPFGDDAPCKVALSILQKWSKDNESSMQTAIKQQGFGEKYPIKWNNAFLAFMESMSVYLRDYNKVADAWKLYREFKVEGSNDTEKLETAISLYQDANYDIDVLAQGWGMDFTILCDLVDQSPDKQPDWDGPFCGAFFTTTAQETAPFISIAFKGTKPTRKPEVQVDYNYDQVTGDKLNQTHCSEWRVYHQMILRTHTY